MRVRKVAPKKAAAWPPFGWPTWGGGGEANTPAVPSTDVSVAAFSSAVSGTIATAGHTFTGLTTANGTLIVGVVSRGMPTSAEGTPTAVNVNGVNATFLTRQQMSRVNGANLQPNHVMSLWAVPGYTGTSATVEVVLPNPTARMGVVAWSLRNITLTGAVYQSRAAIPADTGVSATTRNIVVPAGGILIAYGNTTQTEDVNFTAGVDERLDKVDLDGLGNWHTAGDRLYPGGAASQAVTLTVGPTVSNRMFVAAAFPKA